MYIENFLYVLPYIGKGILFIFIVTAIIILFVMALNRLTRSK